MFQKKRDILKFGNSEADKYLNDIENYPHFFVLACIMDRQIKAERAWLIPYKVSQEIGSPSFSVFMSLSESKLKRLFERGSYHRFNTIMATYFYKGIQKIHSDYQDVASHMWKGNPGSATVVKRFMEFEGISVKIGTMAANILARDFKVPMKDYICIDISPDRHVKRVFERTGLVPLKVSNEILLYRARELNPKYPGVFDLSCFEIGREFCHSRNPECAKCHLNSYCPKVGLEE